MNPTSQLRKLDTQLVLSIIAIGIMSFGGVMAETALNIAFPQLMEEFSIDTSTVQWTTTGYLLILAIIMPISPYLNARFTNRGLFLTAICLSTLGILACIAAPHFLVVILGRVLQGVGTGIALPLMFNVVLELVPLHQRGLMMGVAALITAIAPAVGPSFGGLLIQFFGWRSIFVSLLPLMVFSVALGISTVRENPRRAPGRFDFLQLVLLSCSFIAFITATTGNPHVLVLAAATLVFFGLFLLRSHHSDTPLVHMDIFRIPGFALSAAYIFVLQAIVLGLGYLLPNAGQIVGGLGALAAGCILLPGCTLGALFTPFGGRILDRWGAKRPIFVGVVLLLVAMAAFLFAGPYASALTMALIYLLVPLCQGLSMSNSMTNGLSFIDPARTADGNAAFNTIQQLGGAVGTAVMTAIVNAAQAGGGPLRESTADGAHQALIALVGLAIVAAAAAVGVFYCRPSSPAAARR